MVYTTDGGNTWDVAAGSGGLMYLSADAIGDYSVSSGLFGEYVSVDGGKNYSTATGGAGPCQSVVAFGTKSFGATGSFIGGNGVVVSTNGGVDFTFYPATPVLTTEARYGAFPSATTWYLSAGTWPSDTEVTQPRLSERIGLHMDVLSAEYKAKMIKHTKPRIDTASNDTYVAQIVKTTDGGKTWTSVYQVTGKFYFNQIDCATENICFAVAEADDGPAAGSYIFRTTDGGASWDQVHSNAGAQFSLMAVKMLSTTEIWAAGGDMSSFTGQFMHSTDGGNTWTIDTLAGAYGNALSFVDASHGWSTVFLQTDVSSYAVFA